MLKFALYLNIREDGNVLFHNELFSSFNVAKEQMENFLDNFAKKRGKKLVEISKQEFEKLKVSRKLEDVWYIRKKNSEIIIYSRNVLSGRFYDSHSIEKFGKVGINEFLVSLNDVKNEGKNEDFEIRNLHITNHERGNHVSLVSELKHVLARRERKNIPEIKSQIKFDTKFLEDLVEGKKKLKTVL